MKVLKTLALVSLSAFGWASATADEPVKTMPQSGVTQATWVETGRTPRLFGRTRRVEVVQVGGTMTTTTTTTVKQTTPPTTVQPQASSSTTTKLTPVASQPVQPQRRGLFSRLRGNRNTTTMTTSTMSPAPMPSSSDAKPLPLGK